MKTDSSSVLSHEVSPRVRGLFLKNLGDFQTELARVAAGFVPALVIWRQRKEFPALIFRSLHAVLRKYCKDVVWEQLPLADAKLPLEFERDGRRVAQLEQNDGRNWFAEAERESD